MKAFTLLVFALTTCTLSAAGNQPPRMIKLVTQRLAQPANSFAAEPIVTYRAGTKYGRLEEGYDRAQGIHGLIVMNEPDSWMINLANKTGQHIVDPGPTFDMQAPIIWQAQSKGQPGPERFFRDLQFGNELQFFREHHPVSGQREIEGRSYPTLSLKSGAIDVTLVVDPKSGKPFEIDEKKGGKPELSIRYLSYETNLPFQPALFQPPKNIRLTEAH